MSLYLSLVQGDTNNVNLKLSSTPSVVLLGRKEMEETDTCVIPRAETFPAAPTSLTRPVQHTSSAQKRCAKSIKSSMARPHQMPRSHNGPPQMQPCQRSHNYIFKLVLVYANVIVSFTLALLLPQHDHHSWRGAQN